MRKFRQWFWEWRVSLTLPREIKRALREPINPSDFIEVPRPVKVCEDCGLVDADPSFPLDPTNRVLSHEGGLLLCNDCAILRAKKHQMDQERKDGGA
jgi:hypothetical protein